MYVRRPMLHFRKRNPGCWLSPGGATFQGTLNIFVSYCIVSLCHKFDEYRTLARKSMGNGKIWPPSRNQISIGDSVGDTYHPIKCYPDQIRVSFSWMSDFAHRRAEGDCAIYFLGPYNHPQPKRPHRFWRKIYIKRRDSAQECVFWGITKPKFNIYTPFSP